MKYLNGSLWSQLVKEDIDFVDVLKASLPTISTDHQVRFAQSLTTTDIQSIGKKHVDSIQTFDCGDADLTNFLKKDALNTHGIIIDTYVLCIPNTATVLGYFSFSANEITVNNQTIKLVQLFAACVDKKYQGHGYGDKVMVGWMHEAYQLMKSDGVDLIEAIVRVDNPAGAAIARNSGLILLPGSFETEGKVFNRSCATMNQLTALHALV